MREEKSSGTEESTDGRYHSTDPRLSEAAWLKDQVACAPSFHSYPEPRHLVLRL